LVLWAQAAVALPDYRFEIQSDWLVMEDGVRLSVTYFKPLPRKAGEKFPALLELLPYRKDDQFYVRDYPLYSYFARRGYVAAKVDIRGTGSSEGERPGREYSEAELEDALQIIDQFSKAPWSNGRVGMWGISWGGFNAIQVAMRKPPALKAILAMDASDDLYRDDVHFIDGIFHVDEYELSIDHDLGLPQSPEYRLDEEYFRSRFDKTPWFFTYLKNQLDGEFWRKNSLRWQYDAIAIPTYLIGGLLDGYRDSVPRMIENMTVPVKGVIGPWPHAFPDNGKPGPNYEWRHEAVRWWDHWLKGKDTGILEEPRFAVFVRGGHSPGGDAEQTPGHWRYEDWPIIRTDWLKMYPDSNGGLTDHAAQPGTHRLQHRAGYGSEAGYWWGDPTGDMRSADAGCLVYDSATLDEAIEIVGFPRIHLQAATDSEMAHWVVRLEDVCPDGQVSLVTGAAINGSQCESRTEPRERMAGVEYPISFELHFTTWTFQEGHRIRVTISNGQFPMFWPTPSLIESQLRVGAENTYVALPVVPFEERPAPKFLPPEPREERTDARRLPGAGWPARHQTTVDHVNFTTSVKWRGESNYEIQGRRYYSFEEMLHKTNYRDPAETSFLGEAGHRMELRDRILQLNSKLLVTSDEKSFHVSFTRRIFENGALVRKRSWSETIPRLFQ
jgi:predicted acyl esterase